MGSGVGVMVGVEVASGVEVTFGVSVQPGGMVGKPGRMEQAVLAVASQSLRKTRRLERRRFVEGRINFILFLYW